MTRSKTILLLAVLAFLLSACGGISGLLGGSQEPLPDQTTQTATLSVEVWGQPQPAKTNLPHPTIDFLPAVATPDVSIATPIEAPTGTPTEELEQTPTDVPVTPLPSLTPTVPESIVNTILFTGPIVPARCVQAAIDFRGEAGFLYADVRDLISEADLAVGTLNAALSDYPPHLGCVRTYVFVGSSSNADAIARAGFDVMNIATTHIKNCGMADCGDRAFLDTLDNLRRVGIQYVGGGEELAEALQPVVVNLQGVRFGIVSLGELERMAFAAPDIPGIAGLDEGNLRTAVDHAREVADVVIVMAHWGPDYSHTPNYSQLHYAQAAVDAGADLVVGNHSHVIQGMQEIEGVPVFYGLGSFVFDQDWSLDTQQGIVLLVTFEGARYAGYELIPVHIDGEGKVQVAPPLEAADILERFVSYSEG
jgi:poly-gamma-glutamate capsule biosynthesis protein CapA/YwtB (metallophosphatase superfamily)